MTRWNRGDPQPFDWSAGAVGVLLIHGFTGTAADMRLIGSYLHERGLTVSAPLLPGHGTTPADLNRRRWQEWLSHAERALFNLQGRCQTVFVAGLSMGALLAIHLLVRYPDVAGAALYAPAIKPSDWRIYLTPFAKYFIKQQPITGEPIVCDPETLDRIWAYDVRPVPASHELLKLIRHTDALLPQVSCPLLIVQSTVDTDVKPAGAQYVYERVSSTDKDLVILNRSNHAITLDCEWGTVADRTYRFILKHVPVAGGW